MLLRKHNSQFDAKDVAVIPEIREYLEITGFTPHCIKRLREQRSEVLDHWTFADFLAMVKDETIGELVEVSYEHDGREAYIFQSYISHEGQHLQFVLGLNGQILSCYEDPDQEYQNEKSGKYHKELANKYTTALHLSYIH